MYKWNATSFRRPTASSLSRASTATRAPKVHIRDAIMQQSEIEEGIEKEREQFSNNKLEHDKREQTCLDSPSSRRPKSQNREQLKQLTFELEASRRQNRNLNTLLKTGQEE